MGPFTAGLPAVVLYLFATTLLVLAARRRREPDRLLSLLPGLLALPLHLVSLHATIYQPAGLDLGLPHVASLEALLMVVLAMGVNCYHRLTGLLVVAYPIAAVSLLIDITLTGPVYRPLHHLPVAAGGHILLSILAYSILTIAAVQAGLIAVLDRHLRRKRPSPLSNLLPPLETMEGLLFAMVGAGFLLLTAAIATGFLTLEDMFAQHVVHKTVLTLLAWLVFGGLLVGRHFLGWRGHTAIRWTVSGFVLLLLGFFGSKLVLELLLVRPTGPA